MRARKGEGKSGSRKEVNAGLLVLLPWFVIRYFEVFIWLLLIYFSYFFDATVSGFLQDESLQGEPT